MHGAKARVAAQQRAAKHLSRESVVFLGHRKNDQGETVGDFEFQGTETRLVSLNEAGWRRRLQFLKKSGYPHDITKQVLKEWPDE